MPRFGKRSTNRLLTCHKDLEWLFCAVVKDYDCTILTGYRGRKAQNKAFNEGRSKIRFPDGKHNKKPSIAVDVAPWPVDWTDTKRFYHFAGYVQGVAESVGIPIRWGGDWDRDYDLNDQSFNDLVHFELTEKRK